ncbi:glycosyltransferase family protein [Pseudoxanthomonas composti]|uniref:Glycosyltransferase n=1 Tax=Pseudoxanthomonas composti TaxID=2137479 RepID=A0A4Q1JTD3_9GAMM|nr:glycosyltransferase [Pseudoxanthomonas composti]RXR02740.1 glycosyltransferase [Pseudoxanthomonas composti]
MKPWRVLLLDTKRSNPNHYICLAIARALSRDPGVECLIKADYASAIAEARRQKCNLLLAFDGEELDRSVVQRLADICGRAVLWVTEDPYERSVNVKNSDLFDLVFTNDVGSVAGYGSKGRHLPFAADEHFHFHALPEVDDGHYLYDLFFAGTAWPNRAEFLAKLQAGIPEIRLKLALPANPYIPPPKLGMELSEYDWRTPNTEFAKFSNRSRSVLTLHRAFSSSGNDPIAHTPGPRFFEVALAGGFQLVDTSIPEIRVDDFFTEGKEYVGFSNAQECIQKLEHYLAYPQERLVIARAAQLRARAEHLYANRVRALFTELDALAIAPAPSLLSETRQRRRLMMVSHNVLGVEPYGGVEVYQDSVRRALKDEYELFFYVPDRSVTPVGMRYVVYNEAMQVVQSYDCAAGLDESLLSCPEREQVFSRLLEKFQIDLVHFQHLIGHVPSLGFIPSALGIPAVSSLHDYYVVCSRFNLLDYRGVYCNIPALPAETCDVCLNAAHGLGAGSQAKRRAFFGRMLLAMDALHANTEGVASLFRTMYPLLEGSDKLRIMGVPMPLGDERAMVPQHRPELPDTPLRIAIVGNFTKNKGGDQLVHAFNQLRTDNVEFTVIGRLSEPYSDIFNVLKIPNLRVHGAYRPGSLPQILAGFSMSMHFSIWPETYCISLSEAWSAGLVPIVSDTGALGERVVDGVNGFKLPMGESGAIVSLVRRLIADRAEVERVRANVHAGLGVGHQEHMQWLSGLYRGLLAQLPPWRALDAGAPPRGQTLKEIGVLLMDREWTIQPRGATVVVNEVAQLVPTPEPGRVRRLYRYFRKNGAVNTARRLASEVVRRLSGAAK